VLILFQFFPRPVFHVIPLKRPHVRGAEQFIPGNFHAWKVTLCTSFPNFGNMPVITANMLLYEK
jgi:hypothetical protein